ncbi:Holliday junction resolvase RuvX [Leeia aquatica]|uniref:Putative pre-16S rRNA nuclease n=1 Tax=Leeia aquatica TaxID=2725557 RepID=A0A847SH69_9NEIS|nr:Holliday junction resolvase RuvX [Leeia aquatica]NLR76628.1 Holliday junction resolvase RuvX [Leeia aquatica]
MVLLPRPDWPLPQQGYALGFDFGEQRLGVAGGDLGLALATPLTVIDSAVNDTRFARIAELIAEWQPVWLVVGQPAYPDGQAHPVAALARKFGQRLSGRFNLPVAWVDESYTSNIASQLLHEQHARPRRQKGRLDQLAAQQILQAFFDHYPPIVPPSGSDKEPNHAVSG